MYYCIISTKYHDGCVYMYIYHEEPFQEVYLSRRSSFHFILLLLSSKRPYAFGCIWNIPKSRFSQLKMIVFQGYERKNANQEGAVESRHLAFYKIRYKQNKLSKLSSSLSIFRVARPFS